MGDLSKRWLSGRRFSFLSTGQSNHPPRSRSSRCVLYLVNHRRDCFLSAKLVYPVKCSSQLLNIWFWQVLELNGRVRDEYNGWLRWAHQIEISITTFEGWFHKGMIKFTSSNKTESAYASIDLLQVRRGFVLCYAWPRNTDELETYLCFLLPI